MPIGEARIPILDAGFTRSDVTYDVVAVWKGAFFRLDDHLARFESSWSRLRMSPSLTPAEMREILFECVRRSGLHDACVEMVLSRGVPPPGGRDPRWFENRFYAYAIPTFGSSNLRIKSWEPISPSAATRFVSHPSPLIRPLKIFALSRRDANGLVPR